MPERRRAIELTDPRALRALAHPTRLRLVSLLRREGALTATKAGAMIGESPASCSFHLRQLAKWGLVEEAGGGRGRERPWRATARSTSWHVRSPEDAEPAAVLSSAIVEHQFAELLRWFERMPEDESEWQRSHQLGDTVLRLTADQLEDLGRRVWKLLATYEAGHPVEGAREVVVLFAAYPRA
jgi:DNA-binding transcriptional ArsR family regulator